MPATLDEDRATEPLPNVHFRSWQCSYSASLAAAIAQCCSPASNSTREVFPGFGRTKPGEGAQASVSLKS
ncbi:hypothetical protein R1sor_005673 [Riccia sorocarpa]|uniref:Uncharacterized protein n=1 Tax=Riccia sorocarpa TaxID=122646 RepID=A0ABD3HNS1_9MARC